MYTELSLLLSLCIIFHVSRNYRDIFNLCCIERLSQNSAENRANTPPEYLDKYFEISIEHMKLEGLLNW